MTDALVDVLVRLEGQNALLNQQLGVAKYWCHSLRGAVLQVAREAGPTSDRHSEAVERCLGLAASLPAFLVDDTLLGPESPGPRHDDNSLARHPWLRAGLRAGPAGSTTAATHDQGASIYGCCGGSDGAGGAVPVPPVVGGHEAHDVPGVWAEAHRHEPSGFGDAPEGSGPAPGLRSSQAWGAPGQASGGDAATTTEARRKRGRAWVRPSMGRAIGHNTPSPSPSPSPSDPVEAPAPSIPAQPEAPGLAPAPQELAGTPTPGPWLATWPHWVATSERYRLRDPPMAEPPRRARGHPRASRPRKGPKAHLRVDVVGAGARIGDSDRPAEAEATTSLSRGVSESPGRPTAVGLSASRSLPELSAAASPRPQGASSPRTETGGVVRVEGYPFRRFAEGATEQRRVYAPLPTHLEPICTHPGCQLRLRGGGLCVGGLFGAKRNHCRMCCKSFCGTHCSQRRIVPHVDRIRTTKVCDLCLAAEGAGTPVPAATPTAADKAEASLRDLEVLGGGGPAVPAHRAPSPPGLALQPISRGKAPCGAGITAAGKVATRQPPREAGVVRGSSVFLELQVDYSSDEAAPLAPLEPRGMPVGRALLASDY